MIMLGIDPGKTIGICLYDSESRSVLAAECCAAAEVDDAIHRLLPRADLAAIERTRVYGSGGTDIADACEQTGWLIHRCGGTADHTDTGKGTGTRGPRVMLLERRAVVACLSSAVGQAVSGDSGVWAALCELHGHRDRKGPLAAVRSHARAALAVAYAAAEKMHDGAK